MDFSAEIEQKNGLESPGPLQRGGVPAPSRFLKFLDVKVNQQKEVESLLKDDCLISLIFIANTLLAEFSDISHAVNVIAKYHQTVLGDGT
jgi:hypothetical protein